MIVVPFLAKSPSWIVSQKEHVQTAPWSPPSATLAVPVEEDPREHFGSAITLEHLVVIMADETDETGDKEIVAVLKRLSWIQFWKP